MGINFPSSPIEGQIHNASPGLSFVYRGSGWTKAPLTTALPKNYIVNPAMQVSQQYGDGGVAVGGYAADQWVGTLIYAAGATLVTHRYNPGPAESGVPATGIYPCHAIVLYASVARPFTAADQYCHFYQYLEGQRMAEFQWGTANAKQAVLCFSCMAVVAGSYSIAVHSNVAPARCYYARFTVTAADTWQNFVMVIPGDTAGTWVTDNTYWGYVTINGAFNTNWVGGTPNIWQTGNFYTDAPFNCFATVGGYFRIARVGLYLDPYLTGVAPPFEMPVLGNEIRRCQRYWYRNYGSHGPVWTATATAYSGIRHPVPMRGAPTASVVGTPRLYDAAVTPQITSINTNYCNDHFAEFHLNCGGTFTAAARGAINYWQDANQYIAVSAR